METKWRRWWQTKWALRLFSAVQSAARRDYLLKLALSQWSGKPPTRLCPQHPLGLSEVTGMPHNRANLHMVVPKQTWTRPPPRTSAKGSRRYRRSTLLETRPWSHLCDPNRSGSQQVQCLSPLCPSEINHSEYVFLENALTLILMGSSGWLVLKKRKKKRHCMPDKY